MERSPPKGMTQYTAKDSPKETTQSYPASRPPMGVVQSNEPKTILRKKDQPVASTPMETRAITKERRSPTQPEVPKIDSRAKAITNDDMSNADLASTFSREGKPGDSPSVKINVPKRRSLKATLMTPVFKRFAKAATVATTGMKLFGSSELVKQPREIKQVVPAQDDDGQDTLAQNSDEEDDAHFEGFDRQGRSAVEQVIEEYGDPVTPTYSQDNPQFDEDGEPLPNDEAPPDEIKVSTSEETQGTVLTDTSTELWTGQVENVVQPPSLSTDKHVKLQRVMTPPVEDIDDPPEDSKPVQHNIAQIPVPGTSLCDGKPVVSQPYLIHGHSSPIGYMCLTLKNAERELGVEFVSYFHRRLEAWGMVNTWDQLHDLTDTEAETQIQDSIARRVENERTISGTSRDVIRFHRAIILMTPINI